MPKYGFASVSTLADEINSGYWAWDATVTPTQDSHPRYWENTSSGNPTGISVNIAGLQADQQALARLAVGVWQDVANISFTYTTGAADITFSDAGTDAITTMDTYWDGVTNRLLMTSATVFVPRTWSTGVASGIYSYFFQTMVHEMGHALGLGHSGNYNGGTTNSYYSTNSTLYANDTWQWSVMSYNDQAQYGGATADFVLTPQMADISAIQRTYGAATTRLGNDVYGFNSVGFYNFAAYTSAPAFTIYDSGGIDTLDASGYGMNQTIDLRADRWSSFGGKVNNIAIYTGVVIENAVGDGGDDAITGNDAGNVLRGGAGNDTLDGQLGIDTFYGGLGDDKFEIRNAGDIVVENAGEGTDRYDSYVSIDSLPANVENIVLYGTGDLYAIANGLANAINGTNGSNGLYGLGSDDQIYGYGGDDWIDGGAGNDKMVGGAGNDIYQIDSALDVVVEDTGAGTDRVDSYLTYVLPANVENLVLYGTANLNGTGNALSNVFNGNAGNNILRGGGGLDSAYGYDGDDTLDGGTGADTMVGGAGNDTYYVDTAGDTVTEAAAAGTDTVQSTINYTLPGNVERLVISGSGNVSGTGNSLVNTLTGNSGGNILDGKAGADSMYGGTGDDTYYVDNADDLAREAASSGYDRAFSSVSYGLAATSIEELTLTGSGNNNATGNTLANTLTGNAGNNLIDGGLANDVLVGGGGNDTFLFDTALTANVDTITDFNAANDKIQLDQSVFTSLTHLGTLSAAGFRVGTAAHDSNDYIVYNSATGDLFYDRDGNGASAAVKFAHLNGAPALTNANFTVVA